MGFKKSTKYRVSEEKVIHPPELCQKWVKMWQKVKVLLWKVYILRKRHFMLTFLEIVVPIFLFWLLVHFKNLTPEKMEIVTDLEATPYTNVHKLGNYQITFTPSTNLTESVIKLAAAKMSAMGCKVSVESRSTEEEVISFLKTEYIKEVANKTRDYLNWITSPKMLGVIFVDTGNINEFTYILRTTKSDLETDENSLYGEKNGIGISKYEFSGFLTIQAAIDQAYLTAIKNISLSNDPLVIILPFAQYNVVDLVHMLMSTAVSLGFTFVMPSLLKEVVEERTSGIKEMMKIMGLRSGLNWLSWLVYSLLVYIPVTVAITGFLTVDSGTGPPIDTKFVYVWFIFILFTVAFIFLVLALSTFFTNGTIAMIVGEMLWYGVTILLDMFIVKYPDQHFFAVNLLTCLWPSIALIWCFNTIYNFHRSSHPWTVANLFDDGAGGGRISVGLALIMLLVDIAVFSLIIWYMDNVKPGPYGRAKPPWFIFKRCCRRKKKTVDNVFLPNEAQENFEIAPKNVKVGIRIENLYKTFNKGTLVAVNHVNLDIYQGNITALLGHNGAGKTTLMSMLAGFFSPNSGRVMLGDKNIFEHMSQFRSSLGLCPQHNLLFSYFTPHEHLIFFGMLKGLNMKQAKEKSERLLKKLNMYNRRNYTIAKLSGGMKRKVSLAISLIGDPQVVLLDEPTAGMDPESRRQVWDMLLNLRGERTMILTTHFMEEADVLGDRIAIMSEGQISCYGTSMFLKKLYGKGYQLHIGKNDSAPVAPIADVMERHSSSGKMKISSPSQLSFHLKLEDSPQFPDLFSALENERSTLGLTTIGINCTTIEDVFLRVVGGNPEDHKKQSLAIQAQIVKNLSIDSKIIKYKGWRLRLQQVKALVYKRILIKIRSWISTFVNILVPVVLMAGTLFQIMHNDHNPAQDSLEIALSSFPKAIVGVSSDNEAFTSVMQQMVSSGNATYEPIPSTTNMNSYMADKLKGESTLIKYERTMIAGFEWQNDTLIAGYSNYFDHSFALVLNLIPNILLQLNNVSASITVYSHPLAVYHDHDVCDLAMYAQEHVSTFPQNVIFLSLGLLIMTMNVIAFPLRERVLYFKQVQFMSGVSPLLYWLVIFLCDFTFCLLTSGLMICMIFVLEQNSIFSTSGHIGTVALILVLYGCSGIPFAYFFSFFVKSAIKATVVFVLFNLAVGLFGATFLTILDKTYTYFGVWRFCLSFNPLFSATSALIHLFTIMYLDGTCTQCKPNCNSTNTDPFHFIEPGPNTTNPHGINSFIIFLVVDSFIYLGLILLIEYGCVKKLRFVISTLWIKHKGGSFEDDMDVKLEKCGVLSSHSIGGQSTSTAVFKVFDLGKKYNRKTTAVHGVTFKVSQGECFGLLGVNGAGKTTTFKMLTGEEIPDKGDAKIHDLSLRNNRNKFLACIGYCPQYDPISPQLTCKEMLSILGLLRGIPTADCATEVSHWIDILGMQGYANRPCGAYSGGNKRKLSTAMAFIGYPSVVFLDEPTTGVDPVSRRRLWDIVAGSHLTGQAIVLTSHSMEECEALCTRLTIMVGGRMKCIGSPQYLKHKFGRGFTIKIKMNSTIDRKYSLNHLKEELTSRFRHCKLKDEHLGLLHYHLLDPSMALSKLFKEMERIKKNHAIIEDYIVSHTTLEEVFMSFARENVTQL